MALNKYIFFITFLFIGLNLYSQNQVSMVKGLLMDDSGPVAFANILVMDIDSAFVDGTTSDNVGNFSLINIPYGKYIIKISFLGYETIVSTHYIDKQMYDMGRLLLHPSSVFMKEVVVTASRPIYALENGVLITNVEGTLLNSIGSASDVLEKIPGINMKEGIVNVFGKGVPIIYINHRKCMDQKELERLQSSEIESVELIKNPGSRYDAEGKAVLIINTKKTVSGLSIQLSETLEQSIYLGDEENLSLSYGNKGLSLFASFYHCYEKKKVDENTLYTINADTLWKQEIKFPYKYKFANYNFSGGFDWSVNDRHSFGVQYQTSFSETRNKVRSTQFITANDLFYDDVKSLYTINDDPKRHLLNAFYQGVFNDNFILQFDFDYLKNKTQSIQHTDEQSYITGNRIVETDSYSLFDLYAGKLTIDYDMKNIGKLQFGAEFNNIRGNGYYFNEDGYVKNNIYTNHENKAAGFINYQKVFGKLELAAGVRYEYSKELSTEGIQKIEKVNKRYHDFYPNITLAREFGLIRMALSANRKTKRPSFVQLNNNNVYVNRFLTQKGNPYLEKEGIYEINYQMIYRFLNIGLGYTFLKKPISYTFESDPITSAESILSYKNYQKYQKVDFLISANYSLGIWKSEITGGIIQPFFDMEQKLKNRTDFSCSFYNDFVLPCDFIFSLNYSYQSRYNSYIEQLKGFNRVDFRLRKSFFNKSLELNFFVHDIFDGVKEGTIMNVGNFIFDQDRKRESRTFSLSIRYKFNNSKKNYRGQNAAQDDINRL